MVNAKAAGAVMNGNAQWMVPVCFGFNVAFIAYALLLWGAGEVRSNGADIIFLTIAGAAWLFIARLLFSWLGVSYRDDVVERRNPAALVTVCGALTAVALLYAGGSAGEGPSYWDNVFSVGLGAACFFALWFLLEAGTKVSRSITEDRDLASGIRLGGFLFAIGLMLARAMAGDWHSETATVNDLIRDGWPVAVLWVIAFLAELALRPNRQRPFTPWRLFGLTPALGYVAFAVVWLWHLGKWEGMP